MCCSGQSSGSQKSADQRVATADTKHRSKPCCSQCADKHAATQPSGAIVGSQPVPEIVQRVLYTPGRPLDRFTLRQLESQFHADLGDIRIHVDARAAESAESIGALAYAFGNHIVFGPDMYRPDEPTGRRILVHELAHSLQQVICWNRLPTAPEVIFESAHQRLEIEAEALALSMACHDGRSYRRTRPISEAPLQIACLGANPGCTPGQRAIVHQAIFDANAWVNNALRKLEATPVPRIVVSALRRNFGNTYGVTANLQLMIDRIRFTKGVMNRMPIGCDSAHALCVAGHCGYANAGSLAATICTVSFAPAVTDRFRTRCVLHESFHAAFSRFTAAHDLYSTGHGTSAASPGYPGVGIGPLLNADAYATLVMDLS
jgi:hypothetical protein